MFVQRSVLYHSIIDFATDIYTFNKIILLPKIGSALSIAYYEIWDHPHILRKENIMKNDTRLAVIGGDYRMLSCAKALSEIGYTVSVFGYEDYDGDINNINTLSECIKCADVLILPIPYTDSNGNIRSAYTRQRITPTELIETCGSNKTILGGCLDEAFVNECAKRDITAVDYYKREELKVLNAIPTAEGAIAIAILETCITLHSCKCAVLSFGCVGRATARALHGLGADVTVIARSATALSKAESLGYNISHISEISDTLVGKRLIFNAIPQVIITKDVLCKLDKDAIIIDLASKPGGVDLKSADEYGIRVISALSLPSKYAPVTAGRYLAKTVDHILKGVD